MRIETEPNRENPEPFQPYGKCHVACLMHIRMAERLIILGYVSLL